MRYQHKDLTLELWNSKGTLYKNGKILFRGDGYISIKMFITESDNHPEVIKKFKPQLDSREEVKWKKRDEMLRDKEKAKQMEFVPEPPKKEKPKRTKNNRMNDLFKTVR